MVNVASGKSTTSLLLVFCLITLNIGQTNAFFRLFMPSITIEAVDPIVNPGDKPAAHVHIISGSIGFSGRARFKTLRKGRCTSAPTQTDKSAYWAPMLYFHHRTKGFKAVDQADITVYYKYEMDGTFYPFTKNFQMRAGNSKAKAPDPRGYVKWKCIDDGYNQNTPGLPQRPCKQGLRAEISFPNCWNGRETKGDDNSHVTYGKGFRAYQDNGEATTCPPSHPYKIPRLFMEVMFKITDPEMQWSEAMNPKQPFVLSTGDTTGYQLHADFKNGWIPRYLNRVLRKCDGADGANAASGEPKTCFGDASFEVAKTCMKIGDSPDLPSRDKVVGVWLPKLPGNNPVVHT